MPVDLHLFSTPGEENIHSILEACRPYLAAQAAPVVAFVQWASVQHDWLPYTRGAFAGMAEVEPLRPGPAALAANEQCLDRCGVVYISGGNTYRLNHLLHTSGVLQALQKRAAQGLPIVGFSAGALICGPNILTTHDINPIPSAHFDSLNLLPYNIVAHYPQAEAAKDDEDDWLSDYHAYQTNPILALDDDAYVRWNGNALAVVRSTAWILEPGKPRVRLG
jgi:dipeptidase E